MNVVHSLGEKMINKKYFRILSLELATSFFLLAFAHAYEFPPYQGITLKVTGDLSESYSNNVTFASEEENKVEDYRTMMNLGLDFQYKGKRRSLGVAGRLTRQLSEGSTGIRNPSENMNLSFNNEFSEYDRISLRNAFSHTQEPGRNTGRFDINDCRNYYENTGLSVTKIELLCNEFNEEFGRFTGRFDSFTNNFSLSYTRSISEALSIISTYSYGQNWSTEEGTNDSKRDSIGVRGNYRHSEATRLSLAYDYQLSNYEEGDDISRQSFNVGIDQYITKRLSLNGNVGTITVSSGSDSISLGATLGSEVDEKTSASLSYSQGTEISQNQGDTFKNWQMTSRVTRILLEDFNSSFAAFYGQGEYSSTESTDTLLGASVNLSYNFWKTKRGSSIKGDLGYSYSNLDSTDETRGYTRNSVNTSITAAF